MKSLHGGAIYLWTPNLSESETLTHRHFVYKWSYHISKSLESFRENWRTIDSFYNAYQTNYGTDYKNSDEGRGNRLLVYESYCILNFMKVTSTDKLWEKCISDQSQTVPKNLGEGRFDAKSLKENLEELIFSFTFVYREKCNQIEVEYCSRL